MTTDVNSSIKARAKAKLEWLHKSPKYRSFFTEDAIEAFSEVDDSALVGKSLKRSPMRDVPPS